MSDYDRIAKAISFVAERATEQPSLEEMAAHIHLSPFTSSVFSVAGPAQRQNGFCRS